MIRALTLWLFFLLLSSSIQANELIIRYLPPENPDQKAHLYYVDLLNLALQKTRSSEGSFELKPISYYMVQARAVKELARGEKLDVYWTMTSQEREELLTPIRIPLLKGLLGYRIFIIRREDQEKFASIKRLDDLKQFVAGQGDDWPDTSILRANGINVVGITDYYSIFPMLEKKRIDYFPRGVNEPWGELQEHGNKDFIVEPHILLHYPAPIYFFVNNKNKKLAERIERGLKMAIADDSFNELFLSYPGHEATFRRAKLGERLVFELQNPMLPSETPLNEKTLWLNPLDFIQSGVE